MTTVVDDVRSFFEAERQRPRWRGLVIMTTLACVPLVGSLVLATRMPSGDQPVVALATQTGAIEAPALTLLSVVLSFGTAFLFWLLYTGIAHAITAVFGGEGSFLRYATLFTWGFLPGLAVQLLWLGALVANATAMAPPVDSAANDAWVESVMSGPVMAAVDALYPVAIIVSFPLWVVATVAGRRVTVRQAALAVLPALVIELATFYVFVLQ